MRTPTRLLALVSWATIASLAVAACHKSESASTDAASSSANVAPDTNAAAAPQTASAPSTATTLDYGVMGPPEISPEIAARTPQANLALFRQQELHPQQGTEDHPIEYAALEEIAAKQRALFYAAANGAPTLITPQDWKWVRTEEDYLVSTSCDDAKTQGVKIPYTEEQCADASSRADKPANATSQ